MKEFLTTLVLCNSEFPCILNLPTAFFQLLKPSEINTETSLLLLLLIDLHNLQKAVSSVLLCSNQSYLFNQDPKNDLYFGPIFENDLFS